MRLVWHDELSAGEIATHFEITRPAISQHLRVLREAGLVCERRDGTRRLYRAEPQAITDLQRFLADFWDGGLDRLRSVAEEAERAKRAARTDQPTTPDPPPKGTN